MRRVNFVIAFLIISITFLSSCNEGESQLIIKEGSVSDLKIGKLGLRNQEKRLVSVETTDMDGDKDVSFLEYDDEGRVKRLYGEDNSFDFIIQYSNDRIDVTEYVGSDLISNTIFNLQEDKIISYEAYARMDGTMENSESGTLSHNQDMLERIVIKKHFAREPNLVTLEFFDYSASKYVIEVTPYEESNRCEVLFDDHIPEALLVGNALVFGDIFETSAGFWLGIFLQSGGFLPSYPPQSYEYLLNSTSNEIVTYQNSFSNDQLTSINSEGVTYVFNFE